MLEKLKNIDRRWIFLMILIAVILPLMFPLGLPMKTSKPVENIFYYIESLPEGSVILMSFDFGPSTEIELRPAAEAVARHAFRKNHKILALALWPQGAQMAREVLNKVATSPEFAGKKVYGRDYVDLGYKAGGSVLLVSLKSGFATNFPTDNQNISLAELPMMNEVKDLNNVGLLPSVFLQAPTV